ncbi:hypothetical protein ACMXGV_001334, partial [Campylobacter jejuni]
FKHKKERYWEVTKQEIQKLDTNFLGHRKPLFSLSMVELWERFAFMVFFRSLYLAARFLEAGLLIIIQGKKGFISRFFYYNFRTY